MFVDGRVVTARKQHTIAKLLQIAFDTAPVDDTMAIERQGWRAFELGYQLADSPYVGGEFRAYAQGFADAAMQACIETRRQ